MRTSMRTSTRMREQINMVMEALVLMLFRQY
jgi:hypothetical protein